MRKLLSVLAVFTLFSSTSGCITGHVADAASRVRRGHAERLTAVTRATDEGGSPYAVVALESECRVTPGDPEGGPGGAQYTLPRAAGLDPAEKRFCADQRLEPVAAYHAGAEPEHAAPPGFPDAVLLAETEGGDPALFLRVPGGWSALPVARYLHEKRSRGHPVAATIFEVAVVPFTFVADLATFPFQWFLAPWFPITPP